jgi:hypothetical protein
MKEVIEQIKNGTHKQFFIKADKVFCKCGCIAVAFKNEGYLCSTITAYTCKFNK